MRELVRTNDPVLISAIGAVLDGAGIHHLVVDRNMSLMEGSLGILQSRILVGNEDFEEAQVIMTEAGMGQELKR